MIAAVLVLRSIAFVDADPLMVATFSKLTGKTWSVVSPDRADQIVLSSRQFVMLPWDVVVPRTRAKLRELHAQVPKAHLTVFLAETDDSVTRSLVKQSAREEGVDTIDPTGSLGESSNDRGALALYDALVAGKEDKSGWKVVDFSSQEAGEGTAAMAIDGDPDTYWHTQYSPKTAQPPHLLTIRLPEVRLIGGFSYLPRQDGGDNGTAAQVDFSWSRDGKKWSEPVVFECKKTNGRTSFVLKAPVKVKWFRFRILAAQNGAPYGSAAEIGVLPALLARRTTTTSVPKEAHSRLQNASE